MSKINGEIILNEFKPDFSLLINKFPELKKFIKQKDNKQTEFSFDWKNNQLSLLMTKCILNHYFDIEFYYIPNNFLIPPVPSRLNYIKLIHTILSELNSDNLIDESITGIDIGTGASLIYPILGRKIYNWNFLATEANQDAYDNALNILKQNQDIIKSITLIKQKYKDFIFIGMVDREKKYTFSMCNPPYYDYKEEIKIEDKNKDCEYNFDEIYYDNGEKGFFDKYFDESICFAKNIFLFTILIGKKENAGIILEQISTNKNLKFFDMKRIKNGNNIRYIIYWSFFKDYKEFKNEKLFSKEYNKFIPIFQNQ